MLRFFVLIFSLSAGALFLIAAFASFFDILVSTPLYASILCLAAAVCFFVTALFAALAFDSPARRVSAPSTRQAGN